MAPNHAPAPLMEPEDAPKRLSATSPRVLARRTFLQRPAENLREKGLLVKERGTACPAHGITVAILLFI